MYWSIEVLKYWYEDFRGDPMIKNLSCNAGGVGSIPDGGTKIPTCLGVTKPEHHNYWVCALNLLMYSRCVSVNHPAFGPQLRGDLF